jgi:hypothetical protein
VSSSKLAIIWIHSAPVNLKQFISLKEQIRNFVTNRNELTGDLHLHSVMCNGGKLSFDLYDSINCWLKVYEKAQWRVFESLSLKDEISADTSRVSSITKPWKRLQSLFSVLWVFLKYKSFGWSSPINLRRPTVVLRNSHYKSFGWSSPSKMMSLSVVLRNSHYWSRPKMTFDLEVTYICSTWIPFQVAMNRSIYFLKKSFDNDFDSCIC